MLNCAIELWRNLEIDDDELLEIAVRDVSFQIRLQADREKGLLRANVDSQASVPPSQSQPGLASTSIAATESSMDAKLRSSSSFEGIRRRFNPRVDPTVLFIEMKKLTLHLDNFHFRIEKSTRRTVFDPVFEGRCMVSLHNISIRLRVECAKERVKRPQSSLGGDMSSRKCPGCRPSVVGRFTSHPFTNVSDPANPGTLRGTGKHAAQSQRYWLWL